jgi:DNA repair exonuclease SbcCD ATPase subunit
MRRLACIAVLAACAFAGQAAETVLTLASGEQVSGELVRESATELVLRRSLTTASGVVSSETTYPRAQVKDIASRVTDADLYAARLKDAPDTADGQYQLARWCADRKLTAQAVRHAKRALAIDAGHAPARELMAQLGYREVDGAWLDEDERLAREGLVKVGGKVLSKAAAETRKALTVASVARGNADQAARDRQHALGMIEKQLAEATAATAALTGEAADLAKGLADGQTLATQQQTQLTALAQRRDDALTQLQREVELHGTATTASSLAYDRAQREYATAKRSLDQLTGQLATGTQRQAAVAKLLPQSQQAVAALTAKRDQAVTDLAAAKGALDKAQQEVTRLQAEFDRQAAASPEPSKP